MARPDPKTLDMKIQTLDGKKVAIHGDLIVSKAVLVDAISKATANLGAKSTMVRDLGADAKLVGLSATGKMLLDRTVTGTSGVIEDLVKTKAHFESILADVDDDE